MIKNNGLVSVFLLLFLIAGVDTAQAQQEGKITDFSRPGRPTMMIYVWGTASTPGIWKVERDVDFLELLSAAQIPNFANIESTSKQTVNVRVYRTTGGRRVEIFASEMKKLLTDGKDYPGLQEGDIILLETITKQRFNLQTIFSAIGAAASIVLLIIRLRQI